ncbi:hypothetical protein ACFQ36_20420, partial [Arthrobacter sp. GCM10027362]|uniref:hypothetical protein n=1 Tax=Arthrobacter sp. GCM10027362 TaxID=3273379 RepID=UPI0036276125
MADQEQAGTGRARRMEDALRMPGRRPSRLPDLGAYDGGASGAGSATGAENAPGSGQAPGAAP